ncbi:SDR family oxidoreductase [Vogesella sp. LIG4]|uniref:SDR family oxidoreductase n=1 Tax=Vogesella sp. LIG4 TaxID=1192162 RepID=UPI00081FE364|nr:SDR family oxidoreductase [Vogesella sp. LIG4]SCK29564.1 NAD(P)-dependent dehydrogenase, short-chain alcohol dehydrogenase family [Vogesella sp. LIG4]
MKLGLAGKVALVTGASRGIGAAIALELAKEGVSVSLVARDPARLNHVATNISMQTGVATAAISGDLSQPAVADAVVKETLARFGHLDILVNNAGATKRGDFFTLSETDWTEGFALKFHGYVRMARAAWPHLKAAQGCIVNIVGIGGRVGSAEFTIGGSVNSALLNFTKALADIGMVDGVRVNAVNPGRIETDRLASNLAHIAEERSISRETAAAELLAEYGTRRFGRPCEIGAFVTFLVSEQAAFVQGSLIDVDGGATRSI